MVTKSQANDIRTFNQARENLFQESKYKRLVRKNKNFRFIEQFDDHSTKYGNGTWTARDMVVRTMEEWVKNQDINHFYIGDIFQDGRLYEQNDPPFLYFLREQGTRFLTYDYLKDKNFDLMKIVETNLEKSKMEDGKTELYYIDHGQLVEIQLPK